MKRALVSIHDVMPSTMSSVSELIDQCRRHSHEKITLLVVPGQDWSETQIGQLRHWVSQGLELAGHGWRHKCEVIEGWYHRMHSLILSRDVAEHLCLDREGVVRLLNDCARWFEEYGFEVPKLYVPPAWAMGKVSEDNLVGTSFELFETLSGVVAPRLNFRRRLPLVGFEADTTFRKLSVGVFNRLSIAQANDSTRPLRIGIHPNDHRLLLRGQLDRILRMDWDDIFYEELVA